MRCSHITQVLLLCLCLPLSVSAVDDLWPDGSYDESVPTPETVLGYPLGARHTPHHLLTRFLEAMASSSPRVRLERIGESYLGRAQFHVIVSAPANLERLDEIRAGIRDLTRIDSRADAARVEAILADTPAIAMLNYSVHGNEASGVEAAMRTVYQLAAGTDETTRGILERVVTVIDPVQNPDGHDRYVGFINNWIVTESNADYQSLEHDEPWPGGRTNAYYFDLNRDWFLLTQVESVNRIKALLKWLPQVAPDLHEMGSNSTYFFHPPMLPVNWNIPQVTRKWLEIYGRANAEAFDGFGWTYYTREDFDMLYPGYGESLPTLLGAIGMTYEQGSARSRRRERRDGTVFELRDATWHHFIASMTTLAVTADRREEKLRDFHRFFTESVLVAASGEIRAVCIPPSDPMRVNKLIERVQLLGGVASRATESFVVRGAHDYLAGRTRDVQLPAGTIVIPLRQTAGVVLKTILEPDTRLESSFLDEERRRIDRGESSRFYDVTAWNLPMTYDLPSYASPTDVEVALEVVEPLERTRPESAPVSRARTAYVVPPDTNANIALVIGLLGKGYRVRVASKSFTLGETEYAPGTAVLRVSRNPDTLHDAINELLAETGGTAAATDTAYTPDGIDLGSGNILALREPRVAVLGGDGFSSYNFGAVRYLFEQVWKLPHSALRGESVGRLDLDRYNVIVLPRSRGLQSVLGERGIARLKHWVEDGGVLVAIGSSVDFIASEALGLSSAPKYRQRRREPGDAPATPAGGDGGPAEGGSPRAPGKRFEVEKLLSTPGAILKVILDERSHLAWGYPRGSVPALVAGRSVYEPITDDQGITAGRYDDGPEMVLSGHVWPEMRELLRGKAHVWRERRGQGQVICFAEDPVFRASYDGLERLFFNAVIVSLAYAP